MISGCPKCSFPLERKRRWIAQRLLFRRLWVCRACGKQLRVWRLPFETSVRFLRSPYTHCIACGNPHVRQLAAPDRIDHRSRHPISVVNALMRGRLYHCNACRHQYYDRRPLRTDLVEKQPEPVVDEPTSPAAKDASARELMARASEVDDS